MANPVKHLEIQCADAAKQREFYSTVFGWEIDTNNPMGYGMVTAGAEGGVSIGIGSTSGSPAVAGYVEVADLDAILAKAKELGAETLMGPDSVPGGPTIAMFRDLEGNVVGIMKGM
jgi:predicted enzyme related to lactoylglutathione lyase